MNATPIDGAKVCLTCRLADWHKTTNGRLHPAGTGRCLWQLPVIALPVAFYYIGHHDKQLPTPSGGFIRRAAEYQQECPAWQSKPQP